MITKFDPINDPEYRAGSTFLFNGLVSFLMYVSDKSQFSMGGSETMMGSTGSSSISSQFVRGKASGIIIVIIL